MYFVSQLSHFRSADHHQLHGQPHPVHNVRQRRRICPRHLCSDIPPANQKRSSPTTRPALGTKIIKLFLPEHKIIAKF